MSVSTHEILSFKRGVALISSPDLLEKGEVLDDFQVL